MWEVSTIILEANVTIMVSDVDRAVHFYRDVLGLELTERYGSKYAEARVNGFKIGFHLKSNEASVSESPAGSIMLGFRVKDLASTVANFRGKGIKFSTEIEEGAAGKFIYLHDPDGNQLYIWQQKP